MERRLQKAVYWLSVVLPRVSIAQIQEVYVHIGINITRFIALLFYKWATKRIKTSTEATAANCQTFFIMLQYGPVLLLSW